MNSPLFTEFRTSQSIKLLNNGWDGSEVNRMSIVRAAIYLTDWINRLTEFASLSDGKVNTFCLDQANKLSKIVDNSKWEDLLYESGT